MQDDGHISPVRNFFKKKWVIIVITLDILVILALVIIAIMNSLRSSTITFNVAPIDATISVNGDGRYTNGTFSFMPGKYEIKVSHPDLEEKTINIELESNHSLDFNLFLSENQEFDFYALKENYKSFQKLQQITTDNNTIIDHDNSADEFVALYLKNKALVEKELPIELYEYDNDILKYEISVYDNVDKYEECKYSLCLKVNMISNYDEGLIKRILSEKGFDLKIIEVIYEKY